jgi:REP element-mobilizing transposase RayT
MQWFKTMTTNEYIKMVKQNLLPRFHKRLWQLSFYDRVIRNEIDLNRIREYIRNNPLNWELKRTR